MINFEIPYFTKNDDWYFYDTRIGRFRLTQKATKKAVDSWLQHYANSYPLFSYPDSFQIVSEWFKDDMEDFKKNGNRYTIDKTKSTPELVAIDGIPVEEYMQHED